MWNYKVSSETKKNKKIWKQKCSIGSLAGILKKYSHISNKRPPNCLIEKFRAKNRILKSVTKICLIQVFCAGILKNHYHIWNQHPRTCLISKFHEKIRTPKFGINNALFGYFWARISKNYCDIWNQLPRYYLIVKFLRKSKNV